MLIAAHSIVGGVVGECFDNVGLAFIVGFLSHFFLDAIPHYDSTDKGKFTKRQILLIACDLVIGVIIFCKYLWPVSHYFFFGVAGGLLPDILDVTPFWKKSFQKTAFGKKFHRFHELLHWYRPNFLIGILSQWAVIALALLAH